MLILTCDSGATDIILAHRGVGFTTVSGQNAGAWFVPAMRKWAIQS